MTLNCFFEFHLTYYLTFFSSSRLSNNLASLIISNYSIRSDNILEDLNNFPLWNLDFFQRDPIFQNVYSRHSHILDYDMLRLGKSMIKDSKYVDAFEFGIIVVTEIGKERGNAIELQGVKKIAVETNQKNDFFNNRLMLIYTGQRRAAKKLVRNIMGNYILSNSDTSEEL